MAKSRPWSKTILVDQVNMTIVCGQWTLPQIDFCYFLFPILISFKDYLSHFLAYLCCTPFTPKLKS